MGVKGKPDIIDIIEKKRLQWCGQRLQWYGHVKRMPEERMPKLIMEWIPEKRRKRGRSRKTWMEGVQAAMTARFLEQDQWRNRKEWRLVFRKTATAVIKLDKYTFFFFTMAPTSFGKTVPSSGSNYIPL
jgi:hypothetical protein